MKFYQKSVISVLIGLLIGMLYYFSLEFDFLYAWIEYIPTERKFLSFLSGIIVPIIVSIIVACIFGENRKERIKSALIISITSVIAFYCILIIIGSITMYNFDR